MPEKLGNHPEFEHRDRLLRGLDRMVAADRLTEDEAARLRDAADASEFDDAISGIRRRHASAWIDEAVGDGRLTHEEADAFRARLRSGEDPTFVRRVRRSKTARRQGDARG